MLSWNEHTKACWGKTNMRNHSQKLKSLPQTIRTSFCVRRDRYITIVERCGDLSSIYRYIVYSLRTEWFWLEFAKTARMKIRYTWKNEHYEFLNCNVIIIYFVLTYLYLCKNAWSMKSSFLHWYFEENCWNSKTRIFVFAWNFIITVYYLLSSFLSIENKRRNLFL